MKRRIMQTEGTVKRRAEKRKMQGRKMEAGGKEARRKPSGKMTEGDEIRLILGFMLPLLLGNVFQQLYTLVDSIVVGRFVGTRALGSVGSVGSISFLLLSLCIGLSGGINIMVAQHFGADDEKGVRRTIGNSIYVTLVSGGAMSVLGVTLAPYILHLMRVPEENFADALTYMRIVCGAMVITAAYNVAAQILRALGDAKTPLYFVAVASVINVVLDLLFVAVLGWGVAGAAWATAIAQLFSTVGSVLFAVRKFSVFRLKREDLLPRKRMINKIIWLGIPLAAQNAMSSLSGTISQSMVNSFGSVVMAAYTAGGRVEQLFSQPYSTMGSAIANFSGQNVGAGKFDRVSNGCRKALYLSLGFSVLVFLAMYFFGGLIVSCFVEEADVIAIGSHALQITAVSYFFSGIVYIYKAMLNGAGDAMFTLGNGFLEIGARLVFLFFLCSVPSIGFWGIWYTAILSSGFAALLCVLRYRSGRWKKKSVVSGV